MVKDILAVAVTIVTLAIGTMAVFWDVLWFEPRVATAQSAKPAVAELEAVKLRGTIKAIDKDKRTGTLVGPQGGPPALGGRDPPKRGRGEVCDPGVAQHREAVV